MNYEVDKGHSALLFRIKHLDVGFTYGRFNDFAGKMVVDEANPAGSGVEITAQMASVDTNDAKRDETPGRVALLFKVPATSRARLPSLRS